MLGAAKLPRRPPPPNGRGDEGKTEEEFTDHQEQEGTGGGEESEGVERRPKDTASRARKIRMVGRRASSLCPRHGRWVLAIWSRRPGKRGRRESPSSPSPCTYMAIVRRASTPLPTLCKHTRA